jgi:plasmid stabilization system protein ParE
MIYRVVLTDRAARELEEAANWWAEHRSPAQPSRWYAGISEALASLSQSPESRPLARENGRFPYEVRELHYGLAARPTHRAVFTIRPDVVLILTIRHAAQADITEEELPQET